VTKLLGFLDGLERLVDESLQLDGFVLGRPNEHRGQPLLRRLHESDRPGHEVEWQASGNPPQFIAEFAG
jgi:hypothetical protein